MKWEPNIVGLPISVWHKQAAAQTAEVSVPLAVEDTNSVAQRANDNDNVALSENVMLAHYQRDRR